MNKGEIKARLNNLNTSIQGKFDNRPTFEELKVKLAPYDDKLDELFQTTE